MLGATLAVLVAVLGATTAAGGFEWTIKPLSATVQDTGTIDTEEIKGTNTFREISELTGIPEQEFLDRFKISPEDFDKPIRDAAHRPDSGFDTETVREFVKEKLGQ